MYLIQNCKPQDELEKALIDRVRVKSLYWLRCSLHFQEFLSIEQVLLAAACIYSAFVSEYKLSDKIKDNKHKYTIIIYEKLIQKLTKIDIKSIHAVGIRLS